MGVYLNRNVINQQTARPPGCKCGRAGTHANATRECLAVVPNPTRTLFPRDALPHKINRRGALKSPTQAAWPIKFPAEELLNLQKSPFVVQSVQFVRRVQLPRVRVGNMYVRSTSSY